MDLPTQDKLASSVAAKYFDISGVDLQSDAEAMRKISDGVAEALQTMASGEERARMEIPFVFADENGPKHLDLIVDRTGLVFEPPEEREKQEAAQWGQQHRGAGIAKSEVAQRIRRAHVLAWTTVALWGAAIALLIYGMVSGSWAVTAIAVLGAVAFASYVAGVRAMARYEVMIGTCAAYKINNYFLIFFAYAPPLVGLYTYFSMLGEEDEDERLDPIELPYFLLATLTVVTTHVLPIVLVVIALMLD